MQKVKRYSSDRIELQNSSSEVGRWKKSECGSRNGTQREGKMHEANQQSQSNAKEKGNSTERKKV